MSDKTKCTECGATTNAVDFPSEKVRLDEHGVCGYCRSVGITTGLTPAPLPDARGTGDPDFETPLASAETKCATCGHAHLPDGCSMPIAPFGYCPCEKFVPPTPPRAGAPEGDSVLIGAIMESRIRHDYDCAVREPNGRTDPNDCNCNRRELIKLWRALSRPPESAPTSESGALIAEMVKQASLGHKLFCPGAHEHPSGEVEFEWEDWAVTFERLRQSLSSRSAPEAGGVMTRLNTEERTYSVRPLVFAAPPAEVRVTELDEAVGDSALEGFIDWCDLDPDNGASATGAMLARTYIAERQKSRAALTPTERSES